MLHMNLNKPICKIRKGYKEWYLNGKRHREDGPAVEYADGKQEWYRNDKLHREDGPAVEYASGVKFWYLNGERIDDPLVFLIRLHELQVVDS